MQPYITEKILINIIIKSTEVFMKTNTKTHHKKISAQGKYSYE